ncbi:MAG: hypothetical protein HKN09_08965 [Saprospiraceae bacterium]|nr:hypothetical protein [Saprospiraceae bacterium]
MSNRKLTDGMEDIVKLARIQLLILVPFVFLKLIRPAVLENSSSEALKIFLLSAPNMFEGVMGVLILTGIGLYLSQYLKLKPTLVYISAIILTGVYVLTQEFKIHNLGGNNVYDPNDVIFSIIGILIGVTIVFRLKPKLRGSV